MFKSLKNLIEILLLAIVGAFFFVFAFQFFKDLFFTQSEVSAQFSGAFMGALFAFLFVRLGDALTKVYERKLKHYNALVRLEQQLNTYLNRISDNLFVINDFITQSDEIIKKGKPVIYFNVLHEFAVDKEIGLELHNLDLINQLFSFEAGVEKMNHSIASTNRFHSDIKTAFIEKNIDFDTYKNNIGLMCGKVDELKRFLIGLEQECKELGAVTRLLMCDKPFFTRLSHLFLKKRISERTRKEVPDEIERLESEISSTQKESKERIDSLLNGNQ